MKKLFLTAMLPILATDAGAQGSISDYWGFGVYTRLNGIGSGRWLARFTAEDTRITNIALPDFGSTALPNHLATDAGNNRIIFSYGARFTVDPYITSAIWSYNFETGATVDITNGFGQQIIDIIGDSSGGASFYNGSYYLWDDQGATQGLTRITFGDDGLVSGISQPYGFDSTLNSLGDIAIDGSGVLFALNANNLLYRMDLNAPAPTLQLMGDYTGYASNGQLFIDPEGRLLTRKANSPNWLSLDPTTAGILEEITMTGNVTVDPYDDLTGGAEVGTVVPEPGGTLLAALGGTLSLLRRRRSA